MPRAFVQELSMAKRILIYGMPGSGKTWLAHSLRQLLGVPWFNANDVRRRFDDWDFSDTGRMRQAMRMRSLVDNVDAPVAIADFVCPTAPLRETFDAHFAVWVDTIQKGRFADTNAVWRRPKVYEYHQRIRVWDAGDAARCREILIRMKLL